jgi:outer membrane protein assembly factor BamD
VKRIFLIIFAIIFSTAHAEETKSPDELYNEGIKKLSGGAFREDPDKAIEIFRKIIELYPESEYAVLAEIGIGDAYYKKKEFLSAVEVYRGFYEKKPDYEKADYILFRIGECFYRLTPSYDRDLTPAQNGILYLNTLIKKYPSSPYREKAEKMVKELKNKLSKRELMIGEFYLKRGDIGSAEKHFEKVLEISDDPSLREKAEKYLKRIRE